MIVFGHFVFNSLFTFLHVTCSFLDILQFLSISHLWIFRFTAHKKQRIKYLRNYSLNDSETVALMKI